MLVSAGLHGVSELKAAIAAVAENDKINEIEAKVK